MFRKMANEVVLLVQVVSVSENASTEILNGNM
ncbi:hypothetical protein BLA15945_03491 [Burkholderia lata]|uniref:Uncharacterized protein n=1 Tax=Burkholderia lata (strain ATCC 17760 / DSM 23089 / LMG 22485 / NCIMB 9086 / R18194 / 383) TaxID=482957 RepID=A0A6P2LY29_BURL3|nr:hypothetical protein BLA15945_03491 [Burkholderia lata]